MYDRRRTTVATFNGLCLVGNVGDLGAKREGKKGARERREEEKRDSSTEIPLSELLFS